MGGGVMGAGVVFLLIARQICYIPSKIGRIWKIMETHPFISTNITPLLLANICN